MLVQDGEVRGRFRRREQGERACMSTPHDTPSTLGRSALVLEELGPAIEINASSGRKGIGLGSSWCSSSAAAELQLGGACSLA